MELSDVKKSPVQQQIDRSYQVEFDVQNGSCALCCCTGLVSYGFGFLCYPVMRKQVSSQEVIFEDRRMNYKSDCWFVRQDKMVPYDRIQDVNVTENCCERCWGVHSVSIQTAGGGPAPEITMIAPKNPKELRDHIIAKRDHIIHNGQPHDDGTGVTSQTPLLASKDTGAVVEMQHTLLRIEKLMEQGLSKLNN